jgi:hypothetical protein
MDPQPAPAPPYERALRPAAPPTARPVGEEMGAGTGDSPRDPALRSFYRRRIPPGVTVDALVPFWPSAWKNPPGR